MTDLELYHYGVKGMKWGVRKKYQDWKNDNADRKIRRLETTRAQNRLERKYTDAESKSKYSKPKQAKKLARALADNKAVFDNSEVTNKYLIAVQKARKDKTYRQSGEYQRAKKDYGKQWCQDFWLGAGSSTRIKSYMNRGNTEKQAINKVAAEQCLATLSAVAVTTLIVATSR